MRKSATRPRENITLRELEIIALIALGYSNLEIGVILYISHETVKTHVRHGLAKMRARTRAELVYRAITDGWLATPSQEPTKIPSQNSTQMYVEEWNGIPEQLLRNLMKD